MIRLALTLLAFLSIGCDTSFNQLYTTEAEKNTIEQLLMESRYEYDKGNFQESLTLALKAYSKSPNDEGANLAVGQAYLSLSGLDPINLARGLISDNENKDPNADKTASLFGTIADIIGIDDTEIGYLAASTSTSSQTNITIYNPKTITEARNSESQVLSNLNTSITFLCPFVDESAKLLDGGTQTDSRHTSDNCAPSPYPRESAAKANFTFGLAHLAEAISFYSVIFYKEAGATKSNLELHTEALNSLTSQPSVYAAEITALATTIDALFPTGAGADESMLNGIFNNLEVTSRAFASVAGLPDEVTSSVSDAITDVKSKSDSVSSASSNSTAMKKSLTKNLTTKLKSQIEDLPSGSDLNDACAAFDQINEGYPRPSNCET